MVAQRRIIGATDNKLRRTFVGTILNEPMPSLNIAIVGVGQIGSTFAYKLARAGHRVTAVARPGSDRLLQLRTNGGILLSTGELAEVDITDTLDESVEYDLIIVTTRDDHVDAVLQALRRSCAKAIQFMFVSFDPERLILAVGSGRSSLGMPIVMASLDDRGRLTHTILKRPTLHGDRRWVDLFIKAGLPSRFEENMSLWLRCQVPFAVAMECISVFAVRREASARWGQSMAVAKSFLAAGRIIKARGEALYPRSKRVMNNLPIFVLALLFRGVSGIKSLRNVLAQGEDEARALIDKVAAAAIGIPSLSHEVELVKAVRP